MKNSARVSVVIEELEKRREQLMPERDAADKANDEAIESLIRNETVNTREKAAAAYAALSSLNEAIAQIDSRLSITREELRAAGEWEAHATNRKRVSECTLRVAELDEAVCQNREKANSALVDTVPLLVADLKEREACLLEINRLQGFANPKELIRKKQIQGQRHLGLFDDLLTLAVQYQLNKERSGTSAQRKVAVMERNKRDRESFERFQQLDTERQIEAAASGRRNLGVAIRNPLKVA